MNRAVPLPHTLSFESGIRACDRQKRIDQFHACAFEVSGIARHHRHVIHQDDGRNLFVQFVIGVWDPPPAPHLCRISVEREDVLPVLAQRRAPGVLSDPPIQLSNQGADFTRGQNRGRIGYKSSAEKDEGSVGC